MLAKGDTVVERQNPLTYSNWGLLNYTYMFEFEEYAS